MKAYIYNKNDEGHNDMLFYEFDLQRVEKLTTEQIKTCDLKGTCLTREKLIKYSNGKPVYFIHLDNKKYSIKHLKKDLMIYNYPNDIRIGKEGVVFCEHNASCNLIHLGGKDIIVRRKIPEWMKRCYLEENKQVKCYIYCTKAKPTINDYNGRIIAEFTCRKVEDFSIYKLADMDLAPTCCTYSQLHKYCKNQWWLSFIHIDNLTPVNLSLQDVGLKKAPQNMCNCKGGVVISIQPKWCDKIMSGEKTVEVRKVVLKKLKGLGMEEEI